MKTLRSSSSNKLASLGSIWGATVFFYDKNGKEVCRAMSTPNIKAAVMKKLGKKIAYANCSTWGRLTYATLMEEDGNRYMCQEDIDKLFSQVAFPKK